MKEMTLSTLIAVFQEMLGFWFWVLIAASLIGLVAVVVVALTERRIDLARFIGSELIGFLGSIFAIWLALFVTKSSLTDIGGPVDVMLMVLIFVLGWFGGFVFGYVALGLVAMARGKKPA
ncbi:MAG: DUF5368 family protein [Siculibacillus sp.]